MNICVFCASSTSIESHHLDLAAEVGKQIGERGHTLISGGGSVGSMGAVAAAARAAGARSIGVIPEALHALEVADVEADELLVTTTMRERKGEMDRRADAFLTLAGGIGTLEELIEVWVARSLGMHDKPVVVLDPDGIWAPLHTLVEHLVEQRFARPKVWDAIAWTTTVEEAFAALERPAGHETPAAEELLEAEP